MRARALGLAFLLLACAREPDRLTLPFPVPETSGTEVLIMDDGERVEAHVVPLGADSVPLLQGVSPPDRLSLEAWIFGASPADLELTPGPLAPLDEDAPPVQPDRVFAAELRDGALAPWHPRGSPSEAHHRFLPRRHLPCRRLIAVEPPQYLGQLEDRWLASTAVGAETVLIATQPSTSTVAAFWLVDAHGARAVELEPRLSDVFWLDTDSDGVLWVATRGPPGALYAIPRQELLTAAPPTLERMGRSAGPVCSFRAVSLVPGQGSPVVFALDRCHKIWRLVGRWTLILDASAPEVPADCRETLNPPGKQASLWAVDQETVLFLPYTDTPRGRQSGTFCRVDAVAGRVEPEPADPPPDDLLAIRGAPGEPLHAGTISGYVYRRGTPALGVSAPAWRPVRPPLIASVAVFSFLPFPGGTLVGGSDGDIDQLYTDLTQCGEVYHVGLDHFVLSMAFAGDLLVVSGAQVRRPELAPIPYFQRVRVDVRP